MQSDVVRKDTASTGLDLFIGAVGVGEEDSKWTIEIIKLKIQQIKVFHWKRGMVGKVIDRDIARVGYAIEQERKRCVNLCERLAYEAARSSYFWKTEGDLVMARFWKTKRTAFKEVAKLILEEEKD